MRQKILLTLLLLPLMSMAQDHPKGYFRNPLDIPMMLAGNFGECRSNHFHSGLDIKTESRENMPVYAVADGYIARIRIQNGGFGHALYLVHPNGYTTVYAHLNDFKPDVQAYMKAEQYKRKSWTVDLYVPASKFPVKKGDLIAYSGNTGSSLAPHLHFEIRDSKNAHPVNPSLFGFDIVDNISPKPTNVYLYDMDKSIYMQEPKSVSLTEKDGAYFVKGDTVYIHAKNTGIAFKSNDYMDKSTNTLTYYTAELLMDGIPQSRITLDDIGYDVTRYLNAFVDYSQKFKGNGWVQCLFRVPGNRLGGIYELNKNRGGLDLSDGAAHKVSVSLTDPFGNNSKINFYVKYVPGQTNTESDCEKVFKVNRENSFVHPNVKFQLDAKDLYDDVCFTFKEVQDMDAYSARYVLDNAGIPLHTYFSLYIKPDKPVPFELRDKIALVQNDGKNAEAGKVAKYDNGWYRASIRNFGEYRLVADTTPPVIIPMQSRTALLNSTRITFKVNEDITSVNDFDARLDGEWLAFEQTGDIFYYTFDEHCPKGDHELKVTATDENGNAETIIYTFKR